MWIDQPIKNLNKVAALIGGTMLVLHLFGLIWPDTWWCSHYLAFLPWEVQMGFLLGAGTLLLVSLWEWPPGWASVLKPPSGWWPVFIILSTAWLMGVFFHHFPIDQDNYGDGLSYQNYLDLVQGRPTQEFYDNWQLIGWAPSIGRHNMENMLGLISYYFKLNYRQIFSWMDTLSGVTFVLVWLSFAHYYLATWPAKALAAIIGITAPMTQIFYGHIELYAPTFALMSIWVALFLLYFKTSRRLFLWCCLALLFLMSLMHQLTYALLLLWSLAMLHSYQGHRPWFKKLLTGRGLLEAIYIPVLLVGAFLYFVVFEDHIDARILDVEDETKRLFLPLFSPAPPFDKYNLFSGYHLFDFLNVLWQWSPGGWLVLLCILSIYRKQINWRQPELLLLGLALILFATLLFVLNPLLSMPMDWDLYSFPAVILLFLSIVLLHQFEMSELSFKLLLPTLAVSAFTIPMIMVNHQRMPHALRLESVGVHVLKSYYERGSSIITSAFICLRDRKLHLERLPKVERRIKAFTDRDVDRQYASRIIKEGADYYATGDYTLAEVKFAIAHLYASGYPDNLQWSMLANFQLGAFDFSYYYAQKLLALAHPNRYKALRVALHCALEAGYYQRALAHCEEGLNLNPDDELLQVVRRRLMDGDQVAEIKLLFQRSE